MAKKERATTSKRKRETVKEESPKPQLKLRLKLGGETTSHTVSFNGNKEYHNY